MLSRGVAYAEILEVRVIDQYPSAIWVIQSQQERHQGRFSGSRGANNGCRGAGCCRQVHSLQHGLLVGIREADVFPSDAVDRGRERNGIFRIGHFGLEVYEEKGTLEADEQILQPRPKPHEVEARVDRLRYVLGGALKGAEIPDGEPDERDHHGAKKSLALLDDPFHHQVFQTDHGETADGHDQERQGDNLQTQEEGGVPAR